MTALLALAWVALGVVLYLRAVRKYGKDRDADGTRVPAGGDRAFRLGYHIVAAPFFLLAIGVYEVACAFSDAANRFTDWYAPDVPRDTED